MYCRFVPAENITNKLNKPQLILPATTKKEANNNKKNFLYHTLYPKNTQKDIHIFLVHTSIIFYILVNGLPFGGPGSY